MRERGGLRGQSLGGGQEKSKTMTNKTLILKTDNIAVGPFIPIYFPVIRDNSLKAINHARMVQKAT